MRSTERSGLVRLDSLPQWMHTVLVTVLSEKSLTMEELAAVTGVSPDDGVVGDVGSPGSLLPP